MAFKSLGDIKNKLHGQSFTLRLFLCLLSGMAITSALPPVHFMAGAFIGFSLFYLLISSFSARGAFLAGWIFGFGYFTTGLYWIGNALLIEGSTYKWAWPLAVAGLPAILSFYTAIAACIVRRFAALDRLSGLVFFTFVFAATEYARGILFTGFPWNLYGYIWANNITMMQILSVGGVYVLTALTVFWCAALGLLLNNNTNKTLLISVISVFFTIAFVFVYGQTRLSNATIKEPARKTNIIAVQPNIAQPDKWNPEKSGEIIDKLVKLSRSDNKKGVTFIIWPETALNYINMRSSLYRKKLRDMLPKSHYLVTGYLDKGVRKGKGVYHNSIATYDSNMKRRSIYHKTHLVPFGEYIPFQKWIPLVPITRFIGFEEGKRNIVVRLDGYTPNFSPLICYEIIFPGRVTYKESEYDIHWIVNVTNDGWYGNSSGPYQHLAKARFRAVEEGLPVIRSANTGVSAVIDAYGRVMESLPLNHSGAIKTSLPGRSNETTIFARTGNKVFWGLLLFLLALYFVCRRMEKN